MSFSCIIFAQQQASWFSLSFLNRNSHFLPISFPLHHLPTPLTLLPCLFISPSPSLPFPLCQMHTKQKKTVAIFRRWILNRPCRTELVAGSSFWGILFVVLRFLLCLVLPFSICIVTLTSDLCWYSPCVVSLCPSLFLFLWVTGFRACCAGWSLLVLILVLVEISHAVFVFVYGAFSLHLCF